jgi:aspartyl-tRNA(Asn)/glutamyl-tRNA(Gln) amidotransferase subunit C
MTEITEDLTRKVADLARLNLTDEEIRSFTGQLKQVLKYVDEINEIDTSQVEPMTHPHDMGTPFREDKIVEFGISPKTNEPKILENAPDVLYGGFKVPPIL